MVLIVMECSWRSLFSVQYIFHMGDIMVGFILRAVYGTLAMQSLERKEKNVCVYHYILTGCKVALGQGRYRWRHGIGEHSKLHCEIRT